jgi:hypothetical protein
MIERNPMKRADVRAKVSTTLRTMQWCPTVRLGNGHGPTEPQAILAAALGWEMEVAVPTHMRQAGEYPTCYKIDIANEHLKVGIEVDGNSHLAIDRKDQDEKKDNLLSGLGWTVLRFKNKQVMDDLAGCVKTVLSTISRLSNTTPTLPMG